MKHRGIAAIGLVLAAAMGLGGVVVSCSSGDDSSGAQTGDASPDVVVVHDAGTISQDDSSAAVCAPALDPDYAPTYAPPLTTNTACTSAQVQGFYDACFATTATSSGCSTFYAATENKNCVACLYTPQGSASYGAIIALDNGTAEANIGGCLSLVDGDNSATSCGAKYQDGQFCQIDACSGCVIDQGDTTSFTAFTKCETNASSTICAGYVADGGCEKDAKYAACNKATTFEGYMIAIGNLMCASGNVSDAGADSGDASDDAGDASDDANDDAGDAGDDAADGS
jgi:hypothetical protein